ncbi:binding-protein-dependent transport systems inner membrane component [Paenibacillus mucilaginosus 3016]|uniref:Binding-protein-dependent transport systems inner membrane component n=2 Tax=Paenibacillus mucilaginosus TaxID=61624 RepID=H6NJE5_9BACL|nr:carbohydrate ABC transporter permease [Paenibacillus mucilaginosus]AFC29224.1 binding-protein-dependent transport systems inner membrane component [Paenibacillus mucilaginosus 3016]AFH61404.1 ABC transporter permease [Paenibacillus mucilaginosus K02]WFA17952.1 carbohydrate ABC transporter permease [Paenibacillus mucilaginosus]
MKTGTLRKTPGFRLVDAVIMLIVGAVMLICLLPFLHIIAISLSSKHAVLSNLVTIFPREIDFHAYEIVFQDSRMLWSMGLTIVLTVSYTLISMVMSICAAYPLTKENLKGRSAFMMLIVFTMFFSGGLIPEYLLVKQLSLLDNLMALIVPGMISAFNLIILRTFFTSIPASLEESAYLDGSSHIGTLIRIVLPLSLPVLATLSLFYAVSRWNGFMDALFYITNADLYPIQLKLYQVVMNSMVTDLTAQEGAAQVDVVPEGIKAASIMFATTPILIVYPWLQRYFVSGVMIGAVKG